MTKFHYSIIIKIVVLALIIHTVISQCDRKRIIHTIRYLDCIPKRILSFGCEGTCNSYTQPSTSQLGQLVRYCECCQDNDRISRHARIICPNVQGDTPFKYVVVSLSIPTSCLCQPCSNGQLILRIIFLRIRRYCKYRNDIKNKNFKNGKTKQNKR